MAALGEFDRIALKLAPLAAEYDGALGLGDDAALLEPLPNGRERVVSTDTIVAGVHFFSEDPPESVAKKVLRMNLSDCAGMGAVPDLYTLNLCLPTAIGGLDADAWIDGFTKGLAEDQLTFGVTLIGGDSISTPGPAVITVTIFGHVPEGKALLRARAQAGDDVWVSGTLGDAALGLSLREKQFPELPATHRDHLQRRYLVPEPRTTLGPALAGIAHAALDVSDGLIQDLGHIARESSVRIRLFQDRIPVSEAARALEPSRSDWLELIVTGGDDYELAFTAPPSSAADIEAIGLKVGVPVMRIGTVLATDASEGAGVVLLAPNGDTVSLRRTGWRHA